jgi:hypothetical protein
MKSDGGTAMTDERSSMYRLGKLIGLSVTRRWSAPVWFWLLIAVVLPSHLGGWVGEILLVVAAWFAMSDVDKVRAPKDLDPAG